MNTSPQNLPKDERGMKYNPALNQGNPELDILAEAVQDAEDRRKTTKQNRGRVHSALNRPTIIVDPSLEAELEQNRAIADEAGERLDMISRGEGKNIPGLGDTEYMRKLLATKGSTATHQDTDKNRENNAPRDINETAESSPILLVLNAGFITETLKSIFGNELELTERQLRYLVSDFESNKRAIRQTRSWPALEDILGKRMEFYRQKWQVQDKPEDEDEVLAQRTQEAIDRLAA
jgi:hypothetical protein